MVADFLLRTAMAELAGAHAHAGDPLHLYPPFLAHQHRFAPATLVHASPWLAVAGKRPPAGMPRRRVAMWAGELTSELLQCRSWHLGSASTRGSRWW